MERLELCVILNEYKKKFIFIKFTSYQEHIKMQFDKFSKEFTELCNKHQTVVWNLFYCVSSLGTGILIMIINRSVHSIKCDWVRRQSWRSTIFYSRCFWALGCVKVFTSFTARLVALKWMSSNYSASTKTWRMDNKFWFYYHSDFFIYSMSLLDLLKIPYKL